MFFTVGKSRRWIYFSKKVLFTFCGIEIIKIEEYENVMLYLNLHVLIIRFGKIV